MKALLASTIIVGSVALAEAQEADVTKTAEPAPRISVTASPIHLALPVVELAAEFNVAPRLGVTVIAGAGRVTDSMDTVTATAYEGGAQLNYYLLRQFAGLHVGAEAMYLHLGDIAQDSTVSAAGLSLAPYVGYKVMTSLGFTFVAQGGVAFAAFKASNANREHSARQIMPLLNLNVGWSF